MSCKSRTFAFAFGIMSVVLMSFAQASAAPVVRDHRGNGAPGGGVTVKNTSGPRKSGKKLWCIGIPCF